MEVRRGGNIACNRIGDSDTRNEAEVVASDASPRCTGVYGEPTVVPCPDPCPSCASRSADSRCFRFRAL